MPTWSLLIMQQLVVIYDTCAHIPGKTKVAHGLSEENSQSLVHELPSSGIHDRMGNYIYFRIYIIYDAVDFTWIFPTKTIMVHTTTS